MANRYDRDRTSGWYGDRGAYDRSASSGPYSWEYGRDRNTGYGAGRTDYGSQGRNLGSARSDYGDRAYGGRLDDRGLERGHDRGSENDRGFMDRAADTVASWFGDEEAERRRRMDETRDRGRDDWGGRDRDEWGSRSFSGRDRDDWTSRRSFDRDRDDWTSRRTFASGYGGTYGATGRTASRTGRDRSLEEIRAHEVMTRDVATVRPEDSAMHAARIMRDEDCGALPVVDEYGRAIGMITDRDITCRVVAEGGDTRRARVSDAMTSDIYACNVNSSLEECLRTMARHQVRRLPIVDDRDRIVGIVSQADLARKAEGYGRREMHRVADVVGDISEPTSAPYR